MIEDPNQLIAPAPGRPATGGLAKKPWDYRVTVAIPHWGDPGPLERVVALMRLQTARPYLIVVDTGTVDPDWRERIEALRGIDCEVHQIRAHAWLHPSEPVATAMDLAMQLCRTQLMLCTHADAFPVSRDAIENTDLLMYLAMSRGGTCMALGYALTDRSHWRLPDGRPCDDYRWMVGHTWTLLNVDELRREGIRWDLAAGCRDRGWDFGPDRAPNIVDTEVFLNYAIRACRGGIVQIGTEENYQRNQTPHFDHVRSAPSSALYLPAGHELRRKQAGWMGEALAAADRRILEWTRETEQ